MKRRKLGEVLRERGKISAEDLSKAISEQHGKVIHLGELMLGRSLVAKSDLITALKEITGVSYLDSSKVVPTREALQQVSRAVAEHCCALPVERKGARLTVIMAEPQNLNLLHELRFASGAEVDARLGFRGEILEALAKHYAVPEASGPAGQRQDRSEALGAENGEAAIETMEFVSTSSRQAGREAAQEVQAELRQRRTPAVQVVSEVIQAALNRQASDIHIEPQANDTAIRIRVDGVLRDLRRVPRSLQNSLVSRVKIISDMDIAERRAPQDGRFMVIIGERKIDVRVSTLPTQYGEKVVMRLLESEAQVMTFDRLGIPAAVEEELTRLLALPQGMLLVTGPTGSGKSTTLYAALHRLRKPSVNIITVEDPIEYVLPGINQVHVNVRAGLTFASCLRSILRQDPNVIMVGEIRDRETAEIAMKAAQTGHLVLSTLHTNDSLSAVIRLFDLQVPAYLIAASVAGVLAQRLLRRLCACRLSVPASAEFLAQMAELNVAEPPETEYRPGGCADCDGSGFKGRIGVYELLIADDRVRAAIRDGGIDAIAGAARSRGMRMMQEDAMEKIRAGVTTLSEALRVVSFETAQLIDCPACQQPLAPAFHYCPSCGAPRDRKSAEALREMVLLR